MLSAHRTIDERENDREKAVFRARILLCAHDGWERQPKEINSLKDIVCATCAVSEGASREFPRNE